MLLQNELVTSFRQAAASYSALGTEVMSPRKNRPVKPSRHQAAKRDASSQTETRAAKVPPKVPPLPRSVRKLQ